MTKKYRVVFYGTALEQGIFRQNMAKLGVADSTLDKYVKRAPMVLKRDLTLADARRYADTIIAAGGLVNIQETGELSETKPSAEGSGISPDQDFVMCHNCGFKQRKEDFCVRCGFDLNSSP